MTTQRSYSDFLTESKKGLPGFFGFEGVGILLFDFKRLELFTIDQNFTEDELAQMRSVAFKKKNNLPISEEEKLEDFERQFKRRNKNQYSTT